MPTRHPPLKTLRMRAGAFLIDNAFRGLSRLSRLHPHADPAHHGAFHALLWRENALACWRESLRWLDGVTGARAHDRSPSG